MDALGNLGIDGYSVLLYLVNFGVLLVLLHRFAYKPLMKVVEERQRRIKDDVEGATAMRKELEVQRAEEEKERATRQATLDEQIASAKKMARDEAKRMLADADAQRDAILAHAASQADAAVSNTIEDAEAEILERMKKVILQVLEDGVPADVAEESVKKSWAAVSK